jgi:hypothetical protein
MYILSSFYIFVTGFLKLLEPKSNFTLKMDSDVRGRYKLITSIEALLDASTELNNPQTHLSIPTTFALSLKCCRDKNLTLAFAAIQKQAINEKRIGWVEKMHGEEENCIHGFGKKSWRKQVIWKT